MAWPTPQDYNEAVQNPRHCFRDKELANGIVETDGRGLPRAVCGAFASVYRVTSNGVDYAVRCFLNDMPDQQLRYERLAAAISTDLLDSTVDFEYQPHGLVLGTKAFPIVKMQWVKGLNLDNYVEHNLADTSAMSGLRDQFRKLVSALRSEGFAHGDLQHGNIIVTEQGLRLVDYDGMYVPQLTGLKSNELGHRNFQHPARTGKHFGPYLDNFSAWIIDTALTCLIEDSSMHGQFKSGEGLLFRREDFVDQYGSDLFFHLESHVSETIRSASRRLRTIIGCDPMNVPPICMEVPESVEHPKVAKARAIVAAMRAEQEAAARKASMDEAERQRLRVIQEKFLERQRRKEEEQQSKTHEKPAWLDDETADALSRTDRTAAAIHQAPAPADLLESAPSDSGLLVGVHRPAGRGKLMPHLIPSAQVFAEHLHLSGVRALNGRLRAAIFRHHKGQPSNYSDLNAVFQCTIGHEAKALKLFCQPIDSAVHRFEINAQVIEQTLKLTNAVLPIELLVEAIEVDGVWYPGVLMPWIEESRNLAQMMRATKADFDHTLLRVFRRMIWSLRRSNLAHGKLEPKNILVSGSRDLLEPRLTLVDYDNLCSTALLTNNIGAAYPVSTPFRHPRAAADEFHLKMDNFPAWLIDTALLVWSFDRALFHSLGCAPEEPILSFEDLKAPGISPRFKALWRHPTREISERAHFLLKLSRLTPDSIPDLPLDGAVPTTF